MSFTLRLAVVVMMLLTASALGLVGYQIVRPRPVAYVASEAPPPPLETGYLAAAHPLPAGTLARDDDFITRMVPAAQLPAGAIADAPEARASMRGALIRAYLDAGSAVTAGDVLRPRDRGFIASVLEQGNRAVSIGVDPISGVSGLIWPGDHVDVILTQQMDKASAAQRVLSETILENVRVIGIDQEIVQGAPAGNSVAGKLARTITLEVNTHQAEKLAVAQQLGRLVLAIVAAKDRGTADGAGMTTTFGSDVSRALANSIVPGGTTIHVIQGTDRSEVTFR